MTQSGAGTAATIDGSGFVRTTTDQSIGGNKTFTGTTVLGNTSHSSGTTLTAGAGTTTGTGTTSGVNVAASGLTTGTLLNVDTGASTFSGNAVNIQSGGNFSGTLVNLTANSTTAGTVLGITANGLISGAAINTNVSSVYTGTGIIRLTANAATGTLLALSGSSIALNNGTAAQITLGTPTGTDSTTEGKALKVLLGTAGDAFYANAATGYVDNFARFRVNSQDVFTVSGTAITTTDSFSQTGAATFSTGTGNISLNGTIVTNIAQTGATTLSTGTGGVSLNGDTTVAGGKSISALAGAGKFDFHLATSTFDTSTGAVTLNGNTATASGITFTAGSGIVNGVNAVTVTTGALTTGSAIKVDVGTSAPGAAVNSSQGLGLDVTGSGPFTGGLLNKISLASVSSTGAFTGTLLRLQGDNTNTGTVLGISGASISSGKAIDVSLAANYTGTGAVSIHGGQFSGSLLNVSATADAVNLTSSLVSLSGPISKGNLLNLAVTGSYAGAGALSVDLTGATGTPTGTAILVNTVSAYTGRFIDLQLAGTSKFSVDPTNVSTTLNIAQTGASSTFSTGQGAISLNGAVTVASGKSLSSAGGAADLDFHLSSGTFQTGTGAVTLNGATTISGTNTFTSGSGAVTLNGSTTIVSGKTLTVGGTTGIAIKAIDIGTCTEATSSTAFSCAGTAVAGLTLANLTATDIITISQQSGTVGVGCYVASVTPATPAFTINCQTKPGNGAVFNVMVVRH